MNNWKRISAQIPITSLCNLPLIVHPAISEALKTPHSRAGHQRGAVHPHISEECPWASSSLCPWNFLTGCPPTPRAASSLALPGMSPAGPASSALSAQSSTCHAGESVPGELRVGEWETGLPWSMLTPAGVPKRATLSWPACLCGGLFRTGLDRHVQGKGYSSANITVHQLFIVLFRWSPPKCLAVPQSTAIDILPSPGLEDGAKINYK